MELPLYITKKELDAFKTVFKIISNAYKRIISAEEMQILQEANLADDIWNWMRQTKQMYEKVMLDIILSIVEAYGCIAVDDDGEIYIVDDKTRSTHITE